ncbi:MAG TPA: hypothetical protein PK185_16260 [Cyclobacteriaceae bacterium]|nr:hypothetical protein [Cyclobacteriaceae bacterium]
MRLQKFNILIIVFLGFTGCKNLVDVEPTKRDSFIHFYEKSANYSGAVAEPLQDGFILIGNVNKLQEFSSIITKTDLTGKVVWETEIPNSTIRALKVTADGYMVLGDSIEVDPLAAQVTDIVKAKARLMKIDETGNVQSDFSWSSSVKNVYFHGQAITIDDDGNVITLGEINVPNSPTRSFVAAHDPATLNIIWSQFYGYVNRDFINSKSIHFTTTQKIIWASSVLDDQSSVKRAYLSVPFVSPNSTFENSGLFGQNDELYYSAADIQPSGTGFGIIGTFSNIQSQNQNIYFVRTDPSGNVMPDSQKFFDGVLSADNTVLTSPGESESQDTGNAIIATTDGGYLLAGSMESTTKRGNGGKDIFLIRLDPFGNMLWNKIIGGSGDEIPSTVRLTNDGGFLICGSSVIGGLSSVFLIKTDKNGETK